MLEKCASSQLIEYTNAHSLSEPLQSAYRSQHSTESALACVHNDFLRALDDQKAVMLLMLDLSAAFDTVDHRIMLQRLQDDFGVTGSAHCSNINWTQWNEWNDCISTVEGCQTIRSRRCLSDGGDASECPGENQEFQNCDIRMCSEWSSWGSWSICSAECMRSRTRRCLSGGVESTGCPGDSTETEGCSGGVNCPDESNQTSIIIGASAAGVGILVIIIVVGVVIYCKRQKHTEVLEQPSIPPYGIYRPPRNNNTSSPELPERPVLHISHQNNSSQRPPSNTYSTSIPNHIPVSYSTYISDDPSDQSSNGTYSYASTYQHPDIDTSGTDNLSYLHPNP
ncbi:uncharacterized protein [Amphiura filiformis]|uniref:uncharacterized protein n=1 Tax=Amphiura filiformis TaxID=82378 RepID=UPI003B21D622